MNFNRGRQRDEPEINFIPLIDLLLVVLIFLVVSSTYTRFGELKLTLPETSHAASTPARTASHAIELAITAQGSYQLLDQQFSENQKTQLITALRTASTQSPNPSLAINADALATHQSVITAMEAAGEAGIKNIRLITQQNTSPPNEP